MLFDLDGTLSDSAPGILAALRHAFAVHGLPQLDARTEQSLLGPPFYESLPPFIGNADLDAVIASYRERYGGGAMFDATVFPGVREVLDAARAAGRRLAVATSKPEHFAAPVIEHLGLTEYFETVGGDDLDGSRPTKALVIEEVLRRLGDPAADDTVMVGDRSHDVVGAREHGIDCVGVAWGYALPGELEQAGARPICTDAGQLLEPLGLTGDATPR